MPGNHYTPLGYCDVIDVENFLLTEIDSTFEPQILDWIATSEAKINRFLGYTTASGILSEAIVDEVTDTRTNTTGDLMVFPHKIPITAVTAITVTKGSSSFGITLTDGSTNLYNLGPNSDYIMVPADEVEIVGTSGLGNFLGVKSVPTFIKLSYTAGFSSIPADIRQATVNLVADIVMRHSNKEGLESITQGRVSKRYWARRDGHSDFYLDAMELLRPYRIASRWL